MKIYNKGAQNYRERLNEMAYCEELGFDGVVFNEHHYSAYGTMPSPNLIAGSPDNVARQILAQMWQIGAGHFMGMFHIGNLAHDKVVPSLDLFHTEIMPRLR